MIFVTNANDLMTRPRGPGVRINQPLATAYYMKEDLRCFWDQADKTSAEQFFDDWIARAQASGIKMLQAFAKTLVLHPRGSPGHPRLVRRAHFDGAVGRHQQQNQNPPKTSLRLPGPAILQMANLRPPRSKVRINRMNQK